jgi:hypothetical protein
MASGLHHRQVKRHFLIVKSLPRRVQQVFGIMKSSPLFPIFGEDF